MAVPVGVLAMRSSSTAPGLNMSMPDGVIVVPILADFLQYRSGQRRKRNIDPAILPPLNRTFMFVADLKGIARCLILCCSLLLIPLQAADWVIEPVDPGGIGRYSSLRIDNDGNAHVSYVVGE